MRKAAGTCRTFHGGEEWDRLGEAPVGHISLSLVALHALWDAWIHERDIAAPLGLEQAQDRDEVLGYLLHEGLDLGAAESFWSELTQIPRSQFHRAYRPTPKTSRFRSRHPRAVSRSGATACGRKGRFWV